jgi:uncharacterized protein (TIGR00369 family)
LKNERINDDELRAAIDFFFKTAGPQFSEFLGFEFDTTDFNTGVLKFDMQDRLIGNPYYRILHGGIISSILDITGGFTVYLNVLQEIRDDSFEKQVERLSKIGTIDLRIDYIRPGKGKSFSSKGYILRMGKRVTVTRMELHNEEDLLIAVGTGTYALG